MINTGMSWAPILKTPMSINGVPFRRNFSYALLLSLIFFSSLIHHRDSVAEHTSSRPWHSDLSRKRPELSRIIHQLSTNQPITNQLPATIHQLSTNHQATIMQPSLNHPPTSNPKQLHQTWNNAPPEPRSTGCFGPNVLSLPSPLWKVWRARSSRELFCGEDGSVNDERWLTRMISCDFLVVYCWWIVVCWLIVG